MFRKMHKHLERKLNKSGMILFKKKKNQTEKKKAKKIRIINSCIMDLRSNNKKNGFCVDSNRIIHIKSIFTPNKLCSNCMFDSIKIISNSITFQMINAALKYNVLHV